jgi:hypothetical protein
MCENKPAETFGHPAAHPETGVMMLANVTEGITQEHLQEVYSDSYIVRVGHDHRPAAPISHPNVTYLSAWIGNTFAGAFMVIKQSAVELELHALLKRSSIKHSRDLGVACLAWAFGHPILRVTAYIIEGLEAAKNYCLKLGFKEEGRRRCACVQGGVVKDVYVLGMTRQDWRTT